MKAHNPLGYYITRFPAIFVLASIAVLSAGCGQDTQHATDSGKPPSGVAPSDANKLPEDIQNLQVSVAGGKFGHDLYTTQTGAVQMVVTTADGPYKLTIDKLFADHDLAANGKTTIGINAPEAGQFTMHLTDTTGAETGTAILDVRPPGSK